MRVFSLGGQCHCGRGGMATCSSPPLALAIDHSLHEVVCGLTRGSKAGVWGDAVGRGVVAVVVVTVVVVVVVVLQA
jgi:hypothetical protein